MARVARSHWWYRGLRDLLGRTLTHPAWQLPAGSRILDAGCGTGESLRYLGQRFDPSYLGGFDASDEAVALARDKAPEAEVYLGDICNPERRQGDLDLILSLDVIPITGDERALPGLKRLVELLRPGGLLILNLPAFSWLSSEHDVAVHTTQRFTRSRVRSLAEKLHLEPELLTYRMFFLFPAVLLARLPSLLGPSADPSTARSDLHQMPGDRVNRGLFQVLCAENALIRRGARFPWGSSVYAVARKP